MLRKITVRAGQGMVLLKLCYLYIKSGKNRPSRSDQTIIIDNYEVTIFPAESVNHSHVVPANSAMPSEKCDPEMKLGTDLYSTWFYDLQGM